jgi:heat shock protein 5
MTAEDEGTKNKNNIMINSNTNRLSSEEINCMIKDSEEFTSEDKKLKKRVDVKNELES